jgi:hypothetical protein
MKHVRDLSAWNAAMKDKEWGPKIIANRFIADHISSEIVVD